MFDNQADERAVSQVVGVILVVAITVTMASIIGGFALGYANDLQRNVQAGANVDTDPTTNRISVSYVRSQTDSTVLEVAVTGPGADTATLTSAGETYTNTFASDGHYQVTVTAVDGGRRTVVLDKSVSL